MEAFLEWTYNYGSFIEFYLKNIGYIVLVVCAIYAAHALQIMAYHFSGRTFHKKKADVVAPQPVASPAPADDVTVEKFVD